MKVNLLKTFGETHLLGFETEVDNQPKRVMVVYSKIPSAITELELPFEKREVGDGSLLMTLDYFVNTIPDLANSLPTIYVRFPEPHDFLDEAYDYRQQLQTLLLQMDNGSTPYQLFCIEQKDTAVGVFLVDFGVDMTAKMEQLGFAVSEPEQVFEKVHDVINGF